jgi:glycosyltransferase involved in cell wall biosynthesis
VERSHSTPRVSVIMPVFDAGRDLEGAVRSVAAQTWSGRELVV